MTGTQSLVQEIRRSTSALGAAKFNASGSGTHIPINATHVTRQTIDAMLRRRRSIGWHRVCFHRMRIIGWPRSALYVVPHHLRFKVQLGSLPDNGIVGLAILSAGAVAGILRLNHRFQFTLRGLFIATTFLAFVMSMSAWLDR
jgi:hypothetical protein